MKDIRQTITDRIIAMLEKISNDPESRWSKMSAGGLPRNGKTGLNYSGVNVLILWDHAIEQSYAASVWLTYKQAAELGGQVRKGQKSVMCIYFEMVRSSKTDNDGNAIHYPLCKPFWLFNVAQIEGLPAEVGELTSNQFHFNPIAEAEKLLQNSFSGPSPRR